MGDVAMEDTRSVRKSLGWRTSTTRDVSCSRSSSSGTHPEDEDECRHIRRRTVGHSHNASHDDPHQSCDNETNQDQDVPQQARRCCHKILLGASKAEKKAESNNVCSPSRKRREIPGVSHLSGANRCSSLIIEGQSPNSLAGWHHCCYRGLNWIRSMSARIVVP